jgi:hypothetical protein
MRERVNLRIALIVAAGLLLAAGIYASAIRGVADVHYTHARLSLEAKQGNLALAQADLQEASRLEPSNPMFVERLSNLREQRALGLDRNDPAARASLLEALGGYREAARMRPGSPYAWASIALLKLRLDEMDFEFYGALDRAAKLGPWEPPVQIAIVDIGLASWRLLAAPAQATVLAALERALRREESEVRRLAAAHGSLPLICAVTPLQPRLAAFCVKI